MPPSGDAKALLAVGSRRIASPGFPISLDYYVNEVLVSRGILPALILYSIPKDLAVSKESKVI